MIKIRKGYKYQLAYTKTWQTRFRPQEIIASDSGRIWLMPNGELTIKEGYACDGPSGPTIDRDENVYAAFGHDALCQLMREKHLPWEKYPIADKDYATWLKLCGAWAITVKINLIGLSFMRGSYAKPKNRKHVYSFTSP